MSKRDVQRQILQAAGQVFAQKGFEHATVREICQRAGVNLASINYYFGSKQALYVKVVMHARHLREEHARLPQWSPETPPPDKLRMFIATMVEQVLGEGGEPWQSRLIIREIVEPTEACEEMVRETFRPYFEVLLAILGDMLPSTAARHRLEQLAFSVIGQCVYYRVHQHVIPMLVAASGCQSGHYTPGCIAQHITEVTLGALGAEPPLPQAWRSEQPAPTV